MTFTISFPVLNNVSLTEIGTQKDSTIVIIYNDYAI